MKKLAACLLISLLCLTPFSQAGTMDSPASGIFGKSLGAGVQRKREATKLERLSAMGGLTFFKDYQTSPATLNADYSLGSPTATFTATRQATNSTYVDDDGVIKTANTGVNRKNNYYDATGFHARSGVLLEADSTNLLIRTDGTSLTSSFWTAWSHTTNDTGTDETKTNNLIPELTNISGAYSQRIQMSGQTCTSKSVRINSSPTANGTVPTGTVVTLSFFARSQNLNSGASFVSVISERSTVAWVKDNYSSTIVLTPSWRKYSQTVTTSHASCDNVYAQFGFNNTIDTGDSIDFEIWGVQIEKSSTATSFIPTTTAAVTRAADAPSTYVDANGVVQVNATNNTARYQGGYYDATGFHAVNRGLMVEGAGTNLLVRTDGTASGSGLWTGWLRGGTVAGTPVVSQVAVTDLTGISNSNAQRLQYTAVGGDASDDMRLTSSNTGGATVALNAVLTISGWVRTQSTNTGVNIKLRITSRTAADAFIANYDSTALSLTSSWRRFSFTTTITDATVDHVSGTAGALGDVADGDVVDFEIWGMQLEASPYSTSFIPTTTASMSRPAEVLKYVIAGNRTAATETIAIKFAPESAFANDGAARYILDNIPDDTNRFIIIKDTTATVARAQVSTSAAVSSTGTTNILANTSYVCAAVAYGATAGTNSELYTNGVSEGTSTTNYTQNTYGADFYLGSRLNGVSQLNGIIQSVAIFSTAKDATAVSNITAVMNA